MYDLKLYLLRRTHMKENLYDPGLENLSYKIKSRSHKNYTSSKSQTLKLQKMLLRKVVSVKMAELRIS